MTIEDVLPGEWKVLVAEAPADLAMTVEFRDGKVMMHDAPVGEYSHDGKVVVATIGEDVTLQITVPDLSPVLPGIEAPTVDVLQAGMTTKIPDDEESFAEYATLVRQRYDVVAEEEVRQRIAG